MTMVGDGTNGAPTPGELGRRVDRLETHIQTQFDMQNIMLSNLDAKVERVDGKFDRQIHDIERKVDSVITTLELGKAAADTRRQWLITVVTVAFVLLSALIGLIAYFAHG